MPVFIHAEGDIPTHIPHARSKQNDILSQQIAASSNNAVSRIEPSASGLKKERDTAPKI
jgi:hypothetical protein